MRQTPLTRALPAALALALAACGGGGGDNPPASGTSGPSGASTSPSSSGAITAFGSVFVNGHEFATGSAQVMDDDTGDTSTAVSALEVGQVVDVQPTSTSTNASPAAQWLHVHPLARGYVDASDSTANTLTVMGQTVSLDSGTLYSDHRACLGASSPCTAITEASGLSATTAAAGGTTPGTYVSVDGYLFSSAAGSAQIVATLVSVHDAPGATFGAAFKAEGTVAATTASGVTIGGLAVDLSHATCRVDAHATACAGAFAAGDVVSVFSATAPALPATAFSATVAIERKHLPVQTAGAAVEFDGSVSASTPASGGTAATFVVRGVTVDTSALPAGTSLPAAGDLVRVAGTVSADGLSVTASAIRILHAARSVSYAFAGNVTAVDAGSASGTFNVTVLGQTIVVSSQTRLSDRQSWQWFDRDPQSNPFNIATFQTYLAASASQHVAVKAAKDSGGVLQALSLAIWPTSTSSEVAGPVDATPAPVAASASAPATFSIDGVAVSAVAGAIHFARHGSATLAAGDEVAASGSFAAGVLDVAATPSFSNFVLDLGAPHVGGDDVPLY